LVLKKRKGFVKIALKTGTCLLPVIGFGENDLFQLIKHPFLDPLHKLTQLLFRAQFPLIKGGYLGFMPSKDQLVTLVGNPIAVELNENPSDKDIDDLHQKYIDGLMKLYNDYKDIYHKDRKRDLTLAL
jgi:hypothetical protein